MPSIFETYLYRFRFIEIQIPGIGIGISAHTGHRSNSTADTAKAEKLKAKNTWSYAGSNLDPNITEWKTNHLEKIKQQTKRHGQQRKHTCKEKGGVFGGWGGDCLIKFRAQQSFLQTQFTNQNCNQRKYQQLTMVRTKENGVILWLLNLS